MLFKVSIMKYLRMRLLVVMSSIFFSCVFFSVLMSEWLSPYPLLYFSSLFQTDSFGRNFPLLVFSIFFINMVWSSFVFVTLPGFAFFPLSSAFLAYRACIWGFLLFHQPTWLLLIAVPTIVLEGLGYCFAAVAGTVVGVSWIKPEWVYGAENCRVKAFKRALKECLAVYLYVAIFLFFSAVVEAATLMIT